MKTRKPIPEELERERKAVSEAPAPRTVPTYDSVSETKAARYPAEAKPLLRREIVKR